MMHVLLAVSIVGVSLGSFVNTCAYRIPMGISLTTKRSFCPNCFSAIRALDLIPVVSYFALRGRCRACGNSIPARYIIVELSALVLSIAAFLQLGVTLEFLSTLLFSLLMLLVAIVDWEHLIIPNELIFVGLLAGVLSNLLLKPDELRALLLDAIAAALMVALIRGFGNRLFGRESMGWGDVKLSAVITLFLGIELFLLSLWTAALMGTGFAFWRQLGFRSPADASTNLVPFGTFLALASILMILFRYETEMVIVQWLISTP